MEQTLLVKPTRKEQIYSTAIEMFKSKGYVASSMRDLAGELDIKAASLYSHIKSKEEILQNVCFGIAHEFFKGLENLDKDNFAAKAKLKAAIASHISVITENYDEVAVFLNEWKHLEEPYLSDFVEMRNQYENEFRKIIKFGIDKYEFNIDDVDFAVMTILSSLNWTCTWYKPQGKMTAKEVSDKLSEILIKGIS